MDFIVIFTQKHNLKSITMIFQFFNNNDISCQLGTIVTYMSYANWGIYVPIVHKVLRTLKTVKSINDLKTNRNLLSKINTNISTLKCYNFDLEGDDIENSSFQIEMDETIPHIAYTKWAEEKIKIKEEGEKISIEGFIQFYTNQINIEEKAQYVRKQSRPNDINKTTVSYINSINSYYTTINQPIHEQKRSNYRNQPNKGNGAKGKPRNEYQRNQMLQDPQAMEGHLHLDTAFSVKPILMTQASAKLLNIQLIINLSNVRSITHVICVSKQVSIKPILALRS